MNRNKPIVLVGFRMPLWCFSDMLFGWQVASSGWNSTYCPRIHFTYQNFSMINAVGTQDLLTWLIILLVEYLADPHQLAPTNFSSLDFGSWKGLFNRFAFGKVLIIYALLLLDIVSASFVSMVSRLYVWLGGKLPGSQLDGEIVLLTQCTKNKVSMNDIWVISLCLFIFMCLTHMSHLRCFAAWSLPSWSFRRSRTYWDQPAKV